MPYYPTVAIPPVSAQRTVTFRGVRRHDRIREGEWSRAENLSSALAPMLSVRAPRGRVTDCGGTVLAVSASDPAAALFRPENDPDSVILRFGDESLRFDCAADTDAGGIVRMGARLVLPRLNVWVNTVTLEQGALSAAFSPGDTDIHTLPGCNPFVLKLCPCDAQGNELRVLAAGTAAELQPMLDDPAQHLVADGDCLADGEARVFRRYRGTNRLQNPNTWETLQPLLRVEAAGIGAAGFQAGDWVDLKGFPTAIGNGVWAEDWNEDIVDAAASQTVYNSRDSRFDDDPNGRREIALTGEGFLAVKDVFLTRRVTADFRAAQAASIRRELPEMDFVVEAQNRLWGCRCGVRDGQPVNELYASALGDCTAWQRFSGLATASWAASVGSEGPFTGAGVLDGCPVFFKEGCVHRVYPSASGAHRVAELRLAGTAKGCADSVTPFDGGLAYVSPLGVVRWAGGGTTLLSEELGPLRPSFAAAGAWGGRLFVALREDAGDTLWVWDARHETWFSESLPPEGLPVCFAATGTGLLAASGNAVWDLTGRQGEPEGTVRFSCTSGLIGYAVTGQKYVSRLVLRARLPRGSRMDVWLEYDSDGVWHHAGHLRGQDTGSFLLPVRPRRCDHFRLRLTGEGDVRLFSIVKHVVKGSDKP